MVYLLDTNICVHLINQKYPQIRRKLQLHGFEKVILSSIVTSELLFGVENSQQREKNQAKLNAFLQDFTILEYGQEEAVAYGATRAYLKRTGQTIGAVDTFIAAHALANDLILVTNNTREFSRVPNLRLEDWSR